MKNFLKKSEDPGVTLTELMVAIALLGILLPPMVGLFKNMTRAMFTVDSRNQRQAVAFQGQMALSRDFEEMNEIVLAGSGVVRFYMDRTRFDGTGGFQYRPFVDEDGDGFANNLDPDDDGDAFEGVNAPGNVRTARDLITRPSEGWKQGSDLQDDDDDGDEKRDLSCEYFYNSGNQTIERRFSFNEEPWTTPEVLFDHVVSSTFTFGGGEVWQPERILADNHPKDGMLSQTELDALDGVPNEGLLDDFRETQWITWIDYSFDILVNEGADKQTVQGRLSPRLMAAKEKFR